MLTRGLSVTPGMTTGAGGAGELAQSKFKEDKSGLFWEKDLLVLY